MYPDSLAAAAKSVKAEDLIVTKKMKGEIV
jgi:hypothetical protein